MAVTPNEITRRVQSSDIPNGTYEGIMSGYQTNVTIEDVGYVLKHNDYGVRGFVTVDVVVTDNKIEIVEKQNG
jgi:hypothetical protein